jgi:allantoinase
MDPVVLARLLAHGPARIFDLPPAKGTLEVGADADLVVLDPKQSWEITADELKYKNRISAFVGLAGTGAIVRTYVRGRLVVERGAVVAGNGSGHFIRRTGRSNARAAGR